MTRRHVIGISGTGFIARQLVRALRRTDDLAVGPVLTRRPTEEVRDFPARERLTRSMRELVDQSDLVVECSGHVIHATDVVASAFAAGRPVVTMNVEFHVTCGSGFVGAGSLTEAEGDQPGSLAALHEDVVAMGFRPLVYGNLKWFLDRDPTRACMEEWAARLGISLEQVTAFTDGTKLQFEQALVANGLGAGILAPGLLGLAGADLDAAARELARRAQEAGGAPIADYLIARGLPPGVFIAALHDDEERVALRHYKLGDGPVHVLVRNFHLCALEVPKTIRRVLRGGTKLLDNSATPGVSVAAIAKRCLRPGERIERGMGGFDVRGETVRVHESAGHLPIGVIYDAVVTRGVDPGQVLSWDDVELPDSLAVRMARGILAGVPAALPSGNGHKSSVPLGTAR